MAGGQGRGHPGAGGGPLFPHTPPTPGAVTPPPPPPPQSRREHAAALPAAVVSAVERPQGAGRSGKTGAAFPPARPPLRGRSLRTRSGDAGPPGGREEVRGAGAGAGGRSISSGRLLRPAVPAVAPRGFPRCPSLWRRTPAAAAPVSGAGSGGPGGVGAPPERVGQQG